MDQLYSGAAEQANSAVTGRQRHTLPGPMLISGASVIVAIGVAIPLFYFAGSTGESVNLTTASVEVPEKMAALIAPPPPAVARASLAEPVEAEPRAARVEAETPASEIEFEERILSDDDPRWARATAPMTDGGAEAPAPSTAETDELRSKLEKLKDATPADEASPVRAAVAGPAVEEVSAGTIEPDEMVTGTVPPRLVDPVGQPVDTSEEPVEVSAQSAAAALPSADEPIAETAASEPAGAGRDAKVTTHVNMRAGPENEAEVLTVLPTGASVTVFGGCKHWCEVDFKGKRGYVYKTFVSGT